MSNKDAIAAIATPYGRGGIGVVRISGDNALTIALKIFSRKDKDKKITRVDSHKAVYGQILDIEDGSTIDEAILTFMQKPKSFTGEDLTEISVHGSPVILDKILNLIISLGARLAGPGEFTKRAYLNSKIDLIQAEAIADLINSKTLLQSKMAIKRLSGELSCLSDELKNQYLDLIGNIEAQLDFPEEDIEFEAKDKSLKIIDNIGNNLRLLLSNYEKNELSSGINVAILGAVNAGKSTLFNTLLNKNRAITSETPGTTRDYISEGISIDGIRYVFFDTAGIDGNTKDQIEKRSIEKTHEIAKNSDLILYVVDSMKSLDQKEIKFINDFNDKEIILVNNKCDLCKSKTERNKVLNEEICAISVSALKGYNISSLEEMIRSIYKDKLGNLSEAKTISGVRQKLEIEKALESLIKAENGLQKNLSYEFISLDLKESLRCIMRFRGDMPETLNEDVLNRIFSTFCIGK